MSIINSFPNNADEYIGAEEVMRWLHGRTSGVFGADGNAAVAAVPNSMAVTVSAGLGWLTDADGNGIVWWSSTADELVIDPAHSTLDRIDRVIVEWYVGDYSNKPEIRILKGTNSSTPSAPALTNNTLYRQLSLAQVSVPAGTTEITAARITDERLDPTVCGIVTESVTADTSMVAAQYADAVDLLESAIAEAWDGEISDGAITRAKLAPALLNEIGVHSVNGLDGDVVLDAEDVGAMAEWDLLWTNASPTSDFAAQTLTLDLSGYDAVLIETLVSGTANYGSSAIIRKGWSAVMAEKSATTGSVFGRQATVTASGVQFGTGYENATAYAGRMIPQRIYGIKGVG